MGMENRSEQLAIMARDYVGQEWKHTRSKIIREMKRAGYSAEEIVAAIIAASKRAKGQTDE